MYHSGLLGLFTLLLSTLSVSRNLSSSQVETLGWLEPQSLTPRSVEYCYWKEPEFTENASQGRRRGLEVHSFDSSIWDVMQAYLRGFKASLVLSFGTVRGRIVRLSQKQTNKHKLQSSHQNALKKT